MKEEDGEAEGGEGGGEEGSGGGGEARVHSQMSDHLALEGEGGAVAGLLGTTAGNPPVPAPLGSVENQ